VALQNNNFPPFIDTHVHIEYILQKTRIPTFGEFMKKHPFPSNYEGCISVFCDPAGLSPSFGMWNELLGIDGVYGAFGIHPHNASYYDDQVEGRIFECLKHPKAVAWGECGLDYFKMNSKKRRPTICFFPPSKMCRNVA